MKKILLIGFISLILQRAGAEVLESHRRLSFEGYGAFSKTVVTQTPFQFSRYNLKIQPKGDVAGSFHLGVDEMIFGVPGGQPILDRWNGFVGYQYSITKALNLKMSLLRTYINNNSLSKWIGVLGVNGGASSENSDGNVIGESSYGLTFDTERVIIANGSLRGGWLLEQTTGSIVLNPILAEVSGYTNTHHEIMGLPYTVLNLGPRIKWNKASGGLSVSLYLTQSWNLQRESNYKIAPHWAFFSVSGSF